mmetsp:Transcript_24326/g.57636  ORF Transcript_24326/g.57636 Transcript_24326/m.57636 type:complete len:147 (-) Transcript_24326:1438-1878(-)|eukprot:CAMPEP_0113504086 /NCGR_PEP_ID=MMETSP0014_2-20120614/34528_1 /TAXON_ID=2857 /ORGANISM="Nitzschia sp." /LENGTH=146 /DNA_ID=CAMNT_0000399173 /DNA_START=571 /DNA_END=1011 /DNA_ORIENTATION=- /assembly_acc=CAM_ASM_000159
MSSELPTMPTSRSSSPTPSSSSSSSMASPSPFRIDTDLYISDGDNVTIQEDETCFVLCLEMPGCNGRDLTVDLRGNTITIEGYNRRHCFSDDDGCFDEYEDTDYRLAKRQRLRRRFSIPDPSSLAIEQGMATLHKGCLTLYAPKKL